MILIGTGVASAELGVSPRSLYKLVEAGLLHDRRPEGLQAARFDVSEVAELSTWPEATPTALAQAGPVVHVGPLFTRSDGSIGGWGCGPSGWEGRWRMGKSAAQASIGRLLVADISGFVPADAVRRIVGYETDLGLVTFHTEEVDDRVKFSIEKHRVRAEPGGVWQWAVART